MGGVYQLDVLCCEPCDTSSGERVTVFDLEQHGVHFKSRTDQIDTSTARRFFFDVMVVSLAKMEWGLTAEMNKVWSRRCPPTRTYRRV